MLPSLEEIARSSAPAADAARHVESEKNNQQTGPALAVLAHELRSPLNAICFAVQLLRRGGDDAATRGDVENVLGRQTRHMARLIDGLLDFSRIGHGKVKLLKERVDLARLVEAAIEAVRPSLVERRQELTVDLPAGPVILETDQTRFVQVLTNLLENAAKYTDPGGRIELTVVPGGADVVLRVRDNGIGMTSQMLPHIFDPFWQSPHAAHRAAGGMGIGLTLVRQIVEMLGGTISAFSAGPGEGSEFVVHLPHTDCTVNHDGAPVICELQA